MRRPEARMVLNIDAKHSSTLQCSIIGPAHISLEWPAHELLINTQMHCVMLLKLRKMPARYIWA